AAVGSFIGGTASVVGLMLFAPLVASLMLDVGPASEFLLMSFALIMMSMISSGSLLKTMLMILLGLLLGSVGMDQITAHPRFTFDSINLLDGVNFVAMALGLFGISEILLNLEKIATIKPIVPTFRSLIPRRSDIQESARPIVRGSVIGFVMGAIPGIS